MPEDLPVTKCINVLVGITRSKEFFYIVIIHPIVLMDDLADVRLQGKSFAATYWLDSTCWLLQPSNGAD